MTNAKHGFRIGARCVIVIATVLPALTVAAVADSGGSVEPAGDCVLATIDGTAITEADARALQALLSPPPPAAAARRLAVDSALAWWDAHGWLAGTSARGRLEAWRAWLGVGTREAPETLKARQAAADIADVARRSRLVPGACADPAMTRPAAAPPDTTHDRGRRTAGVLDRAAFDERARRVRILEVRSIVDGPAATESGLDGLAATLRRQGLDPGLRTARLPPSRLARPLALALARLREGQVAGPVHADGRSFWLEAP